MNSVGNTIGKVKRVIAIALPMVIVFHLSKAQKNSVIVSNYKYSSKNYTLNIPDSVVEKLPVPSNNLSFNLGSVYYTNFFSGSYSKTEITFKQEPGVHLNLDIKPIYFINETDRNIYLLFEDTIMIKKVNYIMPVLNSSNIVDTINGYRSSLFTFKNKSDVLFKIWISDEVPWCVGPGFYFKKYGGIIRVEYEYKNTVWSLDLENFEKKVPQKKNFKRSNSNLKVISSGLFPFFEVK